MNVVNYVFGKTTSEKNDPRHNEVVNSSSSNLQNHGAKTVARSTHDDLEMEADLQQAVEDEESTMDELEISNELRGVDERCEQFRHKEMEKIVKELLRARERKFVKEKCVLKRNEDELNKKNAELKKEISSLKGKNKALEKKWLEACDEKRKVEEENNRMKQQVRGILGGTTETNGGRGDRSSPIELQDEAKINIKPEPYTAQSKLRAEPDDEQEDEENHVAPPASKKQRIGSDSEFSDNRELELDTKSQSSNARKKPLCSTSKGKSSRKKRFEQNDDSVSWGSKVAGTWLDSIEAKDDEEENGPTDRTRQKDGRRQDKNTSRYIAKLLDEKKVNCFNSALRLTTKEVLKSRTTSEGFVKDKQLFLNHFKRFRAWALENASVEEMDNLDPETIAEWDRIRE